MGKSISFSPAGLSSSMSQGGQTLKSGIDKRFHSIRDIKNPNFIKDLSQNEGGIVPDKGSTIKITGKKTKTAEPNPYEMQIANRMTPIDPSEVTNGKSATGFPKVTFAA